MSQAIHTTNHCGPRSMRGLERYPRPLCAPAALIAADPLPNGCSDPCGNDDDGIAVALRARGKTVVAADLARDGIDFRNRREAPSAVEAIVTNPPLSLAADFVQHGLTLVLKGHDPRTHPISRKRSQFVRFRLACSREALENQFCKIPETFRLGHWRRLRRQSKRAATKGEGAWVSICANI